MSAYFDDDDTSIPNWARPLGKQGYRSFLSLIRAISPIAISLLPLTTKKVSSSLTLAMTHTAAHLGFRISHRSANRLTANEWRDLITAHFDSIFEVKDEDNALRVQMDDFHKLKSQLRARLYPVDIVNHATEIIQRPGPEGTLEVLALDLPTTVRTVSRSEADAWGLDVDDLFDIGRQNLKATGMLKGNTIQLEQGTALTVYTGDPFYAASHALIIDDYIQNRSAHGVLVGVPKRDILIMHRIQNIGAMEAAGAMLQVIVGMHRDGPGSISPNLYWYHDGDFLALPYELEDQSLKFLPPDEFVELMDELGEVASYS